MERGAALCIPHFVRNALVLTVLGSRHVTDLVVHNVFRVVALVARKVKELGPNERVSLLRRGHSQQDIVAKRDLIDRGRMGGALGTSSKV